MASLNVHTLLSAKVISAVALAALTLGITRDATALDRETEIEIRRLEQLVNRNDDTNQRLLQDVRQLQRQMDQLLKAVESIEEKKNELSDSMIKLQNTDIATLKAGQQKLYDNMPILNWGDERRDCPEIQAVHQQVVAVSRNDGKVSIRSLCYDGKVLHLGSELHVAP